MYHYVRDLPNSRFPRIKGMLADAFVTQVEALQAQYEMASVESAYAYLDGDYVPARDLCLLTFDDGLEEHAGLCTEVLADRGLSGVFAIITRSTDEGWVTPTHKNHFLLAHLPLATYRDAYLERLRELAPHVNVDVDPDEVSKTYRWDTPEVAAFKFVLNFRSPADVKERILDAIFEDTFGDEETFGRELYLSWDDARAMQSSGMVLAGHSHRHEPLSSLADQREELSRCATLLKTNCAEQERWPFTYPFGKPHTYNDETVASLRAAGFDCGFCTLVGDNVPGTSRFAIQRVDPKDV